MKGLVSLSLVVLGFILAGTNVLPQERARRVEQTTVPAAAVTSAPEESGEVVRVDTTLVTVPVSVMDRDGRYVYDLRKDDFRLFDLLIGVRAAARTENRRQTDDAWSMSSPVTTIDVVAADHGPSKLLRYEVHLVRCLRTTEQPKR